MVNNDERLLEGTVFVVPEGVLKPLVVSEGTVSSRACLVNRLARC
jgi:hypothetical protein